jgi:hypothetical protein
VRFEAITRQVAASLGLAGCRIVVASHPIGGVPLEEVDEKADATVDAVIALLTKGGATR